MLKYFAYHTFSQCKGINGFIYIDDIMKHKEIVKPEGIYKMKLLSIATLASKSRVYHISITIIRKSISKK